MAFNREIVDAHIQKYQSSCIPSAIEMVLKLLKRVDANYYELQDAWQNNPNGSFSDFDGEMINGIRFIKKFGQDRGKDFPLNELFTEIDKELLYHRYVIISLRSNLGWHMYVIHGKEGDDYTSFSKNGQTTITQGQIKQIVTSMQGTDILIYEDEKAQERRMVRETRDMLQREIESKYIVQPIIERRERELGRKLTESEYNQALEQGKERIRQRHQEKGI